MSEERDLCIICNSVLPDWQVFKSSSEKRCSCGYMKTYSISHDPSIVIGGTTYIGHYFKEHNLFNVDIRGISGKTGLYPQANKFDNIIHRTITNDIANFHECLGSFISDEEDT